MKQLNGLQQWYGFLAVCRRTNYAVLILIMLCTFARSLFVSRVFPVHASGVFSAYTSAVLADHPVAYYHLDETSNPKAMIASDSSGHNYNATYEGSIQSQTGIFGSGSDAAVQLAGDNGYVSTRNQKTPLAAITGNHDRTVELWFKTSQADNRNLFATGTPSHTSIFDISLIGGSSPGGCGSHASAGLYIRFWDADLHLTGLNLANSQWHYVAVTVSNSGNTVNVVIDGQEPVGYVWNGSCYTSIPQTQPFSMPFPVNTSPAPINLGKSDWGAGFNGGMDEVAIYDTALSVKQLVNHYNQNRVKMPNPPRNAVATHGDHFIIVSWQPPMDNALLTQYKIISVTSQYGQGTVIDTVPSNVTSYQVKGLHNCESTQWSVEAVDAQGNASRPSNTTNSMWTYGSPHSPPPVVIILADGVGSEIPGGTYFPISQVSTYCPFTGANTSFSEPLSKIIKLFDNPSIPPGYGSKLTDTLAGSDAVILPFSYKGISFTGNPSNPSFKVTSYNQDDVADTDPQAAAETMDAEVHSIHKIWKKASIYIIGHSNGGLVAGFWWFYHGRHDQQGVKHVWALDAPLNGIANILVCKLHVVLIILCSSQGVGNAIILTYAALWKYQSELDPRFLASDTSGTFTPIGTPSDPLFDLANKPHPGIISQLYFNEPDCANSGFDMNVCKPQWPSVISDCNVPSNGPHDLSGHTLVENCHGVINLISKIVSNR